MTGSRLAVSAGDANDGNLARGMAMVCRCQVAKDSLRAFDADIGNWQVPQIGLANDGAGAGFYGVRDEVMTVGGSPGPRDEYAARAHILARLDDRSANLCGKVSAYQEDLVAGNRSKKLFERRSHIDRLRSLWTRAVSVLIQAP